MQWKAAVKPACERVMCIQRKLLSWPNLTCTSQAFRPATRGHASSQPDKIKLDLRSQVSSPMPPCAPAHTYRHTLQPGNPQSGAARAYQKDLFEEL